MLHMFQALAESKSPELFANAKYFIYILSVFWHMYNTHSLQSHRLLRFVWMQA